MTRWQDQAECQLADPTLFDEVSKEESQQLQHQRNWHPASLPRVRAALAYCADCPVWKQCVVDRSSDTFTPVVGVYGRQYVGPNEAGRRRRRAAARANSASPRRDAEIRRLRGNGVPYAVLVATYRVSPNTIQRICREAS